MLREKAQELASRGLVDSLSAQARRQVAAALGVPCVQ
jgi:hypothetical protein